MLALGIDAALESRVSIHAPRCREAMQPATINRTLGALFQSTPLVAERRCHDPAPAHLAVSRFNPRPSLPRGDAATQRRDFLTNGVSIHAPRCREAMRPVPADGTRPPSCFNPRPSLPRGDAPLLARCVAGKWVSIHAPRCREAMPSEPSACLALLFMFQSTPLVAERRCKPARRPRRRQQNVSIHAPRCREAMPFSQSIWTSPHSCFNPRPSLPRGDASAKGPQLGRLRGFNPRPSLPRGDALPGKG